MILTILAVLVSLHENEKSIVYAVVHGFLGGFYLLYKLINGDFRNKRFINIIKSYF